MSDEKLLSSKDEKEDARSIFDIFLNVGDPQGTLKISSFATNDVNYIFEEFAFFFNIKVLF